MADATDISPEDRDLHLKANAFLLQLAGAVGQAALYEADNKILASPVDRLITLLRQLFAHGTPFMFQGKDRSVFVNDTRLRCDGPTFTRHQEFLKQLEMRRISGLSFASELNADQWRAALYIVARCNRRSATPFEEMHAALEKKGLAAAVELMPLLTRVGDGTDGPGSSKAPARPSSLPAAPVAGPPGGGSPPDPSAKLKPEGGVKAAARRLKMDRRLFAGRAYAKAMLTLRDYVENLGDDAQHGYHHLWLQRSVFDLVTMCEEGGWRHVGLVNNKRFDEYLYNHSVNVTVLSLILGLRVGLGRPRLAELGTAAMLHHLGKAQLPKELTEKAGALSPEEKKQLASHPTLGIREILRTKQYNEALLKRVLVMAEHHESFNVKSDVHPYSRIVAVAETFDALTTDRPYRPAYLPDAAVRVLASLAGERLDRNLTLAFIQEIGLYPSGTLVTLSDGSRAVVYQPSRAARSWKTPVVRLIRDAAGNDLPEAPLLDLSTAPFGAAPLFITGTLHPGAEGINAPGYLFLDLPGARKK
jgi:HD-GYP domain-containing protein (c-di-GMP phosphodiesterase class II)